MRTADVAETRTNQLIERGYYALEANSLPFRWSINADGIPTSPEINQQSINWLEKAIAVSDSTDYQALYWLTYFYATGTIVKTDYAKAMQLLVKASEEAGRQQDVTFKQKIDDMITQLRQML